MPDTAPIPPEPEMISVLVVEDDEDDFYLTRSLLRRASALRFEVTWARSFEEGLSELCSSRYDVALLDYRLGARDGLELLRESAACGARTPAILLTGQNDLAVDVQAAAAGAADYLVKGADASALERSIRYARERRRAEDEIRRQAELLDKATDAIIAFSPEGRVLYCNRSTTYLTGYSEGEILEGEGVVFNFTDPTVKSMLALVEQAGDAQGEIHVTTQDGRVLIVESRWTLVRDGNEAPARLLAILTDVTERKALESQFLRSQRMESIGRLVGGIAHDLGNLLVPILLGVKVLQTRHGEDEKTGRTLSMMQKSAQRGADMVKQVLAFARGVEGERVRMRLGSVVEEVEKIVRETFPQSITLRVDASPDLAPLVGDATQLQQVLVNLCVNARDAMPDGGQLLIEAHGITLDDRFAKIHLEARAGRYLHLAVTDTGSGIPPEVLDKIFEPFFTTKGIDKGTGLGLSTVYSIVKSHGGFATVYSEMGEGTTFSIYLPAAENVEGEEPADVAAERELHGAGETILVVDDEPFILETACDILEAAGYRVRTATNGQIGLDTWLAHRAEIALVLTDVMMPEMDGVALIRAIRAETPDLPVVAASGMMGVRLDEVTEAGATAFLAKPFTVARLATVIHAALNAKAEA